MLKVFIIISLTLSSSGRLFANKDGGHSHSATALVEMQTLSSLKSGGLIKYELRINKVYTGNKNFINKHVHLSLPTSGADQGMPFFIPYLEKGELLIGFVRQQSKVITLDASANSSAGGWALSWIPMPARSGPKKGKSENKQFAEAVKWANAYKRFSNASKIHKSEILSTFLHSDSPTISKWAAHLLGQEDGPYENLDILQTAVVSEKNSVLTRLSADWALGKNQTSSWHASKNRKRFLITLAKSGLKGAILDAFVDNVVLSIQRKDFTYKTYRVIAEELAKRPGNEKDVARSIKAIKWEINHRSGKHH